MLLADHIVLLLSAIQPQFHWYGMLAAKSNPFQSGIGVHIIPVLYSLAFIDRFNTKHSYWYNVFTQLHQVTLYGYTSTCICAAVHLP